MTFTREPYNFSGRIPAVGERYYVLFRKKWYFCDMIRCCIFDLDGVVVDTARFHFLAWGVLARRLGFTLTPSVAEATKGVSRLASLDIVLAAGGMSGRFSTAEKERLADEKNAIYLEYVSDMTSGDILPGVADFLADVRGQGIFTVLGSASKNAGTILDRCGLRAAFDAVVDGTLVSRPKPDPEVFLKGAEAVGTEPSVCVVFEDAAAGIEAAHRAGMRAVGVGGSDVLSRADMRIVSFEGLTFGELVKRIDNK